MTNLQDGCSLCFTLYAVQVTQLLWFWWKYYAIKHLLIPQPQGKQKVKERKKKEQNPNVTWKEDDYTSTRSSKK